MSTSTQALVSTPTHHLQSAKLGRSLVGYLSRKARYGLLVAKSQSQPDPAHLATCQRARAAVAARPPGVDQHDLFSPLPPEIEPLVQALRADSKSAAIIADCGEPRIVDLRRVAQHSPRSARRMPLSASKASLLQIPWRWRSSRYLSPK